MNLAVNQIGETGAQHLAKTLEINRSLTTMNLDDNQIGETGAQHLAKALEINRSLTNMNLANNQIGEANPNITEGYLRRNYTLAKAEEASQSKKHLQSLTHSALLSHTKHNLLQEAHFLYTLWLAI